MNNNHLFIEKETSSCSSSGQKHAASLPSMQECKNLPCMRGCHASCIKDNPRHMLLLAAIMGHCSSDFAGSCAVLQMTDWRLVNACRLQPPDGGAPQYLVWKPFQDPSDKKVKAIVAEKSVILAGAGGSNETVVHPCDVTDSGTACAQVGWGSGPARTAASLYTATQLECFSTLAGLAVSCRSPNALLTEPQTPIMSFLD